MPAAAAPVSGSNVIRLQADAQGHYTGSFKINGKPGAKPDRYRRLPMSRSTRRWRAGWASQPHQLDFRYGVNTANGQTKAAHATLERIEIGGIRVRDVEAFVLRDEALTTTLVGMSFLKKLASYSVADGSLSLKQ